jgi:ferredoxin
MGKDGLPHVDEDLCKACAKCVSVCPRNLLYIVRQDKQVSVACMSLDKGSDVKRVCSTGCIGCSLCVRECSYDAIKVTNNLASIDPEKCTNCGFCAKKCPTKAITNNNDASASRLNKVAIPSAGEVGA